MDITKSADGKKLTVTISGRLDTATAPELDSELKSSLNGVDELVLDISALDYISSAGLRVLLSAQKAMNAQQGTMRVLGANEMVREIFAVTGFSEILTLE